MDLCVKLECCCPDLHATPHREAIPVPPQPHASISTSNSISTVAAPSVIVPFGGGKDSTTLMQLLQGMGCKVQWVYYGEWLNSWDDYPKFHKLAAASPCTTVLKAEQHLPCTARLQELNMVPNLPFMDYVAYVSFYTFTAAFFALQHGYNYICVGNEYSANTINLTHPRFGYPINHQYEKAFVAEQATHDYLRNHIAPSLYYFSGLQHMSELEIAQRFVTLCTDRYLHLIISCNWATDDNWCGKCDKCAFVYCMFAAFLEPQVLLPSVWHKSIGNSKGTAADSLLDNAVQLVEPLDGCSDMYDLPSHVHIFEQLMGLSGHKPLECVGTPGEVLAAMYLASQRHQKAGTALPMMLAKHAELIREQGCAEWEKIQHDTELADAGQFVVPTLYPSWYKLTGA